MKAHLTGILICAATTVAVLAIFQNLVPGGLDRLKLTKS